MNLLASLRTSIGYIDPRRRRLLLASIPMSIAITLVELTGLALLFPFIEEVVRDQPSVEVGGALGRVQRLLDISDRDRLLQVTGGVVFGCLLLRSVLGACLTWWQTRIAARAEAHMSGLLFQGYMFEDYLFHTTNHSSVIIRNLHASVREFFQRMIMGFVALVSEGIVMVGILVTLIAIDPVVALGGSAILGLAALGFIRVLGPRARRLGSEDMRMSQADLKLAQEGLNAIKVVQVLNRQPRLVNKYRVQRMEHAIVREKVLFSSAVTRYYLEFSVVIVVALITMITLLRQSESSQAVGLLGVFIAGMFRMLPSLQRVLAALHGIHLGSASLRIVGEELARARRIVAERAEHGEAHFLSLENEIALENVAFSYPNRPEAVLRGVSLTIARGESIGIVGPSGAGKSTLVDVILGLLHPTSGQFVIDGRALRSGGDVEAWRNVVGYVPQEVTLVDESLRRNVALGLADGEIDDDRVRLALAEAQIGELVEQLPEGLHTVVGERGVQLSGGQRQRIGIARALYVAPQVLVLDEATSSLDSATEAAISRTIESLHGQLTMIIVAHRLSTVRRCDRLVLLDQGVVSGSGTFDELMASNPGFQALVAHAGIEASDSAVAVSGTDVGGTTAAGR